MKISTTQEKRLWPNIHIRTRAPGYAADSSTGTSVVDANAGVSIRDLWHLCKPRIVALICITAIAGAFASAGSVPPVALLVLLTVAVALSAASASVFNNYLERDLDSRMARTRDRALPSGRIRNPCVALVLACVLLAASLPAMVALGPWVIVFGLLGAATYAGIYTLVLKPRTSWNIIVGGLAGSFAALGGWSVVGSPFEPGAIALALLLFFWTPPHFWSLAIARDSDYEAAGVPMLPNVAGRARAAMAVFIHVVMVLLASAAFAVIIGLGWLAVVVTAVAGASLLLASTLLAIDATTKRAWTTFKLSNIYLLVILVSVSLNTFV